MKTMFDDVCAWPYSQPYGEVPLPKPKKVKRTHRSAAARKAMFGVQKHKPKPKPKEPIVKYPKGYRKDGIVQIAVRFSDEFFEQIIEMAKKDKKDFNAMVIELCKCGKLCLDESDALEPTPVTQESNNATVHSNEGQPG